MVKALQVQLLACGLIGLLCVGVTSAAQPPQDAPAARAATLCAIGDSGTTVNRNGVVARFRSLNAMRGMNCRSAQYVLNQWLRRAFARSYTRRLPTSFNDGYVTWQCGKLSRLRWQCDEYDSGTAFQFTAYVTY